MTEVVVWNINRKQQALEQLVKMGADLALLQEVHPGGWKWLAEYGNGVEVSPHEPWSPWGKATYDRWPLVVRLSDRIQIEWFTYRGPAHWPTAAQFPTSGYGTVAVAKVIPSDNQEPFIAASMYGRFRSPHPTVGDSDWIHADASVHRIISDFSVFISPKPDTTHRILAAGDLNMNFLGRIVPEGRSQSVLTRMEALGMEYIGPKTSDNERVPTYYTRSQEPATARSQLDHVFASKGMHDDITVQAMNSVDEWGPSDHCRILATLA